MDIFEAIYLSGFLLATIIRSYYGSQFSRKNIVTQKKESMIVFFGISLWGVVLLLPLLVIFSNVLLLFDYELPNAARIFGALVFCVGLWVLWCSHIDLSGNFSPSLFIRRNHTLVTVGIYRKIRHPMYLSFVMWAVGQALLIQNWLAGPLGIIAFLAIYLFRIEHEEQQLIETFGEAYVTYQSRTGRLFPRLRKG